ncbi:hypothetical protein MtrunA17_Chr7g0263041 [Medicago truncatula]|uniref:Uncharacterized protein n=1 Tax=Medicago truncatula TaxID=3880 RepID=A0A396H6E5_MEDTR|nr:hypothetical protein MtrunA17_Chr7g0263041 [Medicago truncatula]
MKSRAGEFGNSLSPFRNSMFSQFSRKNQSNSSLNLPRSNRRLLVIPSQTRRFLSEFLKDIVNETVHDSHSLA